MLTEYWFPAFAGTTALLYLVVKNIDQIQCGIAMRRCRELPRIIRIENNRITRSERHCLQTDPKIDIAVDRNDDTDLTFPSQRRRRR